MTYYDLWLANMFACQVMLSKSFKNEAFEADAS